MKRHERGAVVLRGATAARRVAGSVVLIAGCGPLLVITPAGDSGSTKTLEIDEAVARCDRGDSCACHAAGSFHAQSGSDASARELFDRACSGGCVQGCTDLSEAYFDGTLGARRDPHVGTRYAIRACKLDAHRCEAAGLRFERGMGVARDPAHARAFFAEGCRRADPPSCTALERVGGRVEAPAAPPPSAAD